MTGRSNQSSGADEEGWRDDPSLIRATQGRKRERERRKSISSLLDCINRATACLHAKTPNGTGLPGLTTMSSAAEVPGPQSPAIICKKRRLEFKEVPLRIEERSTSPESPESTSPSPWSNLSSEDSGEGSAECPIPIDELTEHREDQGETQGATVGRPDLQEWLQNLLRLDSFRTLNGSRVFGR